MIALISFVLAVLASSFKSKCRLEAENAVLRHQLIVLRRKVRGRAQPTNNDLCVPKTSSELMTCWNRLSWWNDRAALFRSGRPGLAIQVEVAA